MSHHIRSISDNIYIRSSVFKYAHPSMLRAFIYNSCKILSTNHYLRWVCLIFFSFFFVHFHISAPFYFWWNLFIYFWLHLCLWMWMCQKASERTTKQCIHLPWKLQSNGQKVRTRKINGNGNVVNDDEFWRLFIYFDWALCAI